MGLSTIKDFRIPQSRVNKEELSNYKIVQPKEFAFVPTTDTWKVFAFGLNNFGKEIVVSPIYEVFRIKDESVLLPEYLSMWFKRKEFDRYVRFHSWGSARENFTWYDLCDVRIPIPPLSVQQSIVNIYKVLQTRRKINEQLKEQVKSICPILIKGSLEESERVQVK
jgi:type I restriction enzyme S subunit